MARKITMIPQTINPQTRTAMDTRTKRKVAGYARVSTDYEEQITSYEAQVDYYTNYIQSRDDWEFVKVYTDAGISATNTRHREGFNQMVEDALAGKIDLIITKSVSRFARNTVDSLTTVRKLKEKGIEVYFEKEGIYTLDSKGELLITIMSSLAQEESRSISENVTWGQRKRFADGKVSLPYSHFLGYKKGEDGLPEIVPEEAEIVRFIYRSYMNGQTSYAIAKILTERHVPTPAGKENWRQSTIESILTNEKHLPLIYALMFGMPGIPCVYYGSEWGTKADKSQGDPALRPSFDQPEFNELTQFISNLSAAKKNSVGLNYGDFTSVLLTNKQCIFKRTTENETVYVCINAEENAFDAYCEVKNHTYTDLITNTPIEIGECFKMPGYSAFYLVN